MDLKANKKKKKSLVARFVHSTGFGFGIACIIVLNAIQIGLETDERGGFDWSAFELVFLLIYVTELVLRCLADRQKVVSDPWFIFDFVVVLLSSIDALSLSAALPSGGTVVVLRVARLCKVARIIRLLRFCSELYLLVTSMVGAMKTVFWMWVLLGLVIYMFSILFCNEVGHSHPKDTEIQEWFGSVIRSMFTLFTVLTLDGWSDIAWYLWDISPVMVFLIVIFISMTTYAIVNVVVAVIVQHVIDEALEREEEASLRLEKELTDKTQTLANMFASADGDGNGMLTKSEWVEALNEKSIQRTLKTMDLDLGELQVIFDLIDLDGDGQLSVNEFVQGILQMRGPARARRLFELHCDLTRFTCQTEERFDSVDSKMKRFEERFDRLDLALAGQAEGLKSVQDMLQRLTETQSPSKSILVDPERLTETQSPSKSTL